MYNEMIANPERFHAIIVKKDRSDTTGIKVSVKVLLDIKLDNELNFDSHIIALERLKRFIH